MDAELECSRLEQYKVTQLAALKSKPLELRSKVKVPPESRTSPRWNQVYVLQL